MVQPQGPNPGPVSSSLSWGHTGQLYDLPTKTAGLHIRNLVPSAWTHFPQPFLLFLSSFSDAQLTFHISPTRLGTLLPRFPFARSGAFNSAWHTVGTQ